MEGRREKEKQQNKREQTAADHGFGLSRSRMYPRQIERYCLVYITLTVFMYEGTPTDAASLWQHDEHNIRDTCIW